MTIDLFPAIALVVTACLLGATVASFLRLKIPPTLTGILIGVFAGALLWFIGASIGASEFRRTHFVYLWKWDQVGRALHELRRLEESDRHDAVRQNIVLLDQEFTNSFYDEIRFDRLIARTTSNAVEGGSP